MVIKKIVLVGLVFGVGTAAIAQEFLNFDEIPGVAGQAAISIDLNPMALGIATQAMRQTDPALADIISRIERVSVRVYRAIEDEGSLTGFIDGAAAQLERSDWEQLVSVNDDHAVKVFMQGTDDVVMGVTVMAFGDREAVFVNVAGMITAEEIGNLANRFGANEVLGSVASFTTQD